MGWKLTCKRQKEYSTTANINMSPFTGAGESLHVMSLNFKTPQEGVGYSLI